MCIRDRDTSFPVPNNERSALSVGGYFTKCKMCIRDTMNTQKMIKAILITKNSGNASPSPEESGFNFGLR